MITFCHPLLSTFLRTVCKDCQKPTTKMGSKMAPMPNTLALWPPPPLAMSSLARDRLGTHTGMHAYAWWGSSPRIFSFARSNSASVRRPRNPWSLSSHEERVPASHAHFQPTTKPSALSTTDEPLRISTEKERTSQRGDMSEQLPLGSSSTICGSTRGEGGELSSLALCLCGSGTPSKC